tara:strand:+ start:138 stop:536 length:399 start_codon:yes stop_codon:yes gene_type:complete
MGIIYKIVVGEEIYIGSTKLKYLSQRQSSHNQGLRNPNSKDYNYLLYKFCRENNVEKIICELIETVDNENIFIKEQEYMDLLKPTLNHYRAFQTEEQKIEQKKEHTKIKANCPECGKEMIKNNINRHIRDIH